MRLAQVCAGCSRQAAGAGGGADPPRAPGSQQVPAVLIRHLKLRTSNSDGWQLRHRASEETGLQVAFGDQASAAGTASAVGARRSGVGLSKCRERLCRRVLPRPRGASPARAGRGARGGREERTRSPWPALPCSACPGCARSRETSRAVGLPGSWLCYPGGGTDCRGRDARGRTSRMLAAFFLPLLLHPFLFFFFPFADAGRRARAAAPQRSSAFPAPGAAAAPGGQRAAAPLPRPCVGTAAAALAPAGGAAPPLPPLPHGPRGPRCHRAQPVPLPVASQSFPAEWGKSGAAEGCAHGGMLHLPCRGSSRCLCPEAPTLLGRGQSSSVRAGKASSLPPLPHPSLSPSRGETVTSTIVVSL